MGRYMAGLGNGALAGGVRTVRWALCGRRFSGGFIAISRGSIPGATLQTQLIGENPPSRPPVMALPVSVLFRSPEVRIICGIDAAVDLGVDFSQYLAASVFGKNLRQLSNRNDRRQVGRGGSNDRDGRLSGDLR